MSAIEFCARSPKEAPDGFWLLPRRRHHCCRRGIAVTSKLPPVEAQALVENGGNELVVCAKFRTKCNKPVHLQVVYQNPADAAARVVANALLASLVADPCQSLHVGLDNLPEDPVPGGVLSVVVRSSDPEDRVCEACISLRVANIE
jgi:hypothetical protein